MAIDHSQTLADLVSLQDQPLSIISLSEPISASHSAHRDSNVSTDAFENPSPTSLEADLSHYKVCPFSPWSAHLYFRYTADNSS